MARIVVVWALAAVLIASVLGGYGAVSASHASPSDPGAAVPSTGLATAAGALATSPDASSIALETYNGEGAATTFFCTGSCLTFGNGAYPGGSTLYFDVADAAADRTVNLTINDPNATRDGLVNPVFSATVQINQTTHENLTAENHLSYSFPATLAIGGGWNITASAPLGGFTSVNLTVETFSLALAGSPDAGSVTLPGQTIGLTWIATAFGNGSIYNHLTNLTATGTFTNVTEQNLFSPGLQSLTPVGAGSWTFQVPDNATPDTELFVELWAVVYSDGGIAENETAEVEYAVGTPLLLAESLSPQSGCTGPGAPAYDSFTSGSPVFVCLWLGAHVPGHTTYPIGGLRVTIGFWNGAQNVTPGGSPPTVLTSTSNGAVAFSFIPTSPTFSAYYAYPFGNTVNVSAIDPAATSPGYPGAYENYSFQVLPPASAGAVGVVLNAVDYLAGATVFANWTLGSSNATNAGALRASEWLLDTANGFAGAGPITTAGTSGTVEVTLPSGYVGEFYVGVVASNATVSFAGYALGYAEQPTLLLNAPSSLYYTGGETLSFPTQIAPSALPGTTVYYNISATWYAYPSGATIASGVVAVGSAPSSGVISFTVPTSNPASVYVVHAWAQSPTVGIYSTNSVTVELATGFEVLVGISTPSSYSDGSYQPGQTIHVSWSLSPLGGAPIAGTYSVYLYLGTSLVAPYWQTTSSSGTVSITLPSNTPSGFVDLTMYVYASNAYGPNCDGAECYGISGLTVNAHPSILSLELGAGSGLTVGWLILLIVILVVGLLLVLLIRRGRTPPGPAPRYNASGETIAPPAPAPSNPPATEWKEPAATPPAESPAPAAEAPPPLPTPPSGSQ